MFTADDASFATENVYGSGRGQGSPEALSFRHQNRRESFLESSVDEPQKQCHHHTNQEPRGDRNIESEVWALDDDIARETPEPKPVDPRPQQASRDQNQSEQD
jgi:hypothetical protein